MRENTDGKPFPVSDHEATGSLPGNITDQALQSVVGEIFPFPLTSYSGRWWGVVMCNLFTVVTPWLRNTETRSFHHPLHAGFCH